MGLREWFNKNISIEPVVAPLPEDRGLPEPVVEPPMPKVKKPRKSKKKAAVPTETFNPEKEAATLKGEPWVSVLGIELDADNVGSGAFNLDWNDKFVAKLVRAGYRGKTDQDIVDQWFQTICRSVLEETYEQEMADPEKRRKNNN